MSTPHPTSTEDLKNVMPKLRRRARRLSDSPEVAEDLVQDAALRIWTRLDAGEEIDNMDAYALTALNNLARQGWRDRKPMDEMKEDIASTPPNAPGLLACRDILQAIADLPKGQSDLLTLIAMGEDSPAELAHLTGLPLGTVNSRLARARAKLRAEVGLDKDTGVVALLE